MADQAPLGGRRVVARPAEPRGRLVTAPVELVLVIVCRCLAHGQQLGLPVVRLMVVLVFVVVVVIVRVFVFVVVLVGHQSAAPSLNNSFSSARIASRSSPSA